MLLRRIIALTISAFIILLPLQAFCSSAPDIKAGSAILAELTRGQLLFDKNADEKLEIPMVNKIMTAIIVIERSSLNSSVTISREASSVSAPVLLLEPGEKFLIEDLLYLIMLRSYNDAATALAEFTGGNVPDFVTMMNNKALELNMKNTVFKNPSGISEEGQYTTARDLLSLMKYCLSNAAFKKIFSSRTKIWTGRDGSELVINQNNMFWDYDGINGGKASNAGIDGTHSSVTTATWSGQYLISIVFNSPPSYGFDDARKLLDYGFDNFKHGILVAKDEPVHSMVVEGSRINLVSPQDIYYTHPAGDDYIADITYTEYPDIRLPINTDTILGTARYTLKDGTQIEVSLFSDRTILPPQNIFRKIKNQLKEHRNLAYLLFVLVLIEAVFLINMLYHLMKKKNKRL